MTETNVKILTMSFVEAHCNNQDKILEFSRFCNGDIYFNDIYVLVPCDSKVMESDLINEVFRSWYIVKTIDDDMELYTQDIDDEITCNRLLGVEPHFTYEYMSILHNLIKE